jgi:hypothetical protein
MSNGSLPAHSSQYVRDRESGSGALSSKRAGHFMRDIVHDSSRRAQAKPRKHCEHGLHGERAPFVGTLGNTLNRGLLSSFFCALAGVACGYDSLDVKSAHETGRGTSQVFEGTVDQLWTASHAAVAWTQAGAAQDHDNEHYFVTDPTQFDQIGIWLEPQGSDRTRVTLVVVDDPNLPGPNEAGVMRDVASALRLVMSGLPTSKRP